MGEAERVTPEGLANLARRLAPADLAEVADFIGYLVVKRDRELPPVLRDAPWTDEPLTEEEREAIDESEADIKAGRTIPLEQIEAELGL